MRDRVIGWYFVVSLCVTCSVESELWWMPFLLTANFANAARLVNKVKFSENEENGEGRS